MPKRPLVVAFDIIETTISLEPLREHFLKAGLPGPSLEHWFSIGLRDAFALGATGDYAPFNKVLDSAFDELFAVNGRERDDDVASAVEHGMKSLPAQPGADEALRMLRDGGIRLLALSNGSKSSTKALLGENGLLDYFEAVLSTDEIEAPKPQPQVYRYFLEQAGADPKRAALVATHGWDLQGASAAGLTTAFVRHRKPSPPNLKSPDLEADSLPMLARQILDLA